MTSRDRGDRLDERDLARHAKLLGLDDAALIATDLDGIVTHWNAAAEALYGWSAAEARGRPIAELTVGDGRDDQAQRMRATLASRRWQGERVARRKDGTTFRVYERTIVHRPAGDAPACIIVSSVDTSGRRRRRGPQVAHHDYMRVVAESMGEALFALDEDGTIAFLNEAGSNLLGWTEGELLGRQMHDLVHYQHADGTPFPREECPIMRAREQGEVVRCEDDAFTRRDGTIVPVAYTSAPFVTSGGARGTVVVARDISLRKAQEQEWLERLKHLSWTERIRSALTGGRFVLYAQPIFDLTTGEIVQHELLIRMRDEGDALIPPGQFLPAAEESGLIRQVDEWVVGQAAKLVGEGHAVQINLSATSFAQHGMADVIEDAFVAAGADPSRLVVEFTETALLQDELGARRFADRIVELGVRIALDDFGTGYGGFTYLKHLPVHYLKIDREFVRDISVETSSRHVVEAIVSLARGFGQRTIAEGVERRSKIPILLGLGVDYGQGYGLMRPFPAAKLRGRPASC